LCDVPAYARELTAFQEFQELIRDSNFKPTPIRKVDYLILFEFCRMQNAEKLQGVICGTFRR